MTDPSRKKILAILFSLLIPGLGQIYLERKKRGNTVLILAASALLAVIWHQHYFWYIVLALIWVWNLYDVWKSPIGIHLAPAVILWLFIAYGIGIQVTEFNLAALVKHRGRALAIIEPMLHPTFIEHKKEILKGYVWYEVPCSTSPKTPDRMNPGGVRVYAFPECANINEYVTIHAEGLWPDYPVRLYWYDTISSQSAAWDSRTDENGKVTFFFALPNAALANATDPKASTLHQPTVEQSRDIPGYQLTKTGYYLVKGLIETIALAYLATILGSILALPVSFLAAKNLMWGNVFTRTIYYIVRTILNIFRSIESLILAIIFVVIVGLGPFPGLLAITVHTIAALGKLFSEVIEGIDSGPIEAIKATGANWIQIVRYGVIPQIVPPFIALTIFRWDINVRSSTIIGFVGGGGIGFFLYQWILLGDYRSLSSAFIAIAVVVILLDFFSAKLRERIH